MQISASNTFSRSAVAIWTVLPFLQWSACYRCSRQVTGLSEAYGVDTLKVRKFSENENSLPNLEADYVRQRMRTLILPIAILALVASAYAAASFRVLHAAYTIGDVSTPVIPLGPYDVRLCLTALP